MAWYAGKVGGAIPGSNLLRDYCAACGEPIRVAVITMEQTICNYCLANIGGLSSPGRKGGPGDETAGFGSYYTHGMTAEDQGH